MKFRILKVKTISGKIKVSGRGVEGTDRQFFILFGLAGFLPASIYAVRRRILEATTRETPRLREVIAIHLGVAAEESEAPRVAHVAFRSAPVVAMVTKVVEVNIVLAPETKARSEITFTAGLTPATQERSKATFTAFD